MEAKLSVYTKENEHKDVFLTETKRAFIPIEPS